MRYELLLLPSFHSGGLSGCIRLRFLPGRPADLSVHDRLPEGRELLMIGTILLGAMNRLSSRRDVAACRGASIPDCGTSYLARETTVSTG